MEQKVRRNTFFLLFAQVLAKIVGFLYILFLARFLGVSLFGQYSFAIAFIYFFGAISDFGLNRLFWRDLAREPSKIPNYLSNTLFLRLILSLGAYLLAIILALVLGYSQTAILHIGIVGLILLPQALAASFDAIFVSQEKMHYSSLGMLLSSLLTTLFGILAIIFGFGILGIFVSLIFANILVLLSFMYFSFKEKISWSFSFDMVLWRQFLSASWPFGLNMLIALVFFRADIVILSRIAGDQATGFYSAAYKLVEVGILIPGALVTALFPQMARLLAENKEELKKLYKKAFGILLATSLPLVLVVSFFASTIVTILYGPEYLPAVSALVVLSWSLVLFFVNALPGNIIQSSDKLKSYLPWAFLNMLLNIGLNLVLIPQFSFTGAAYVTLITEITGFAINNYFVWKVLRA